MDLLPPLPPGLQHIDPWRMPPAFFKFDCQVAAEDGMTLFDTPEQLAAFLAPKEHPNATFALIDAAEVIGAVTVVSTSSTELEVLSIGVLEGRRREGHGSAMMGYAEAVARYTGKSLVHLVVMVENTGGIRFYNQLGYWPPEGSKITTTHYSDGKPRWRLEKRLGN